MKTSVPTEAVEYTFLQHRIGKTNATVRGAASDGGGVLCPVDHDAVAEVERVFAEVTLDFALR